MNIDGINMQRPIQRLRASQYRDSLLSDNMQVNFSDDYEDAHGPPVLGQPP
jgi:hypothetical protein